MFFIIIVETVIGMIYGLFAFLEKDAYKYIFEPYVYIYKKLDKEVNKLGTILGITIIFILSFQFFIVNLSIIFFYYLALMIYRLITKVYKFIFRKKEPIKKVIIKEIINDKD